MFDPVGGAASKGLMCNLLIFLLHCVMVDRLVCVLFKLLHLDTDSGFEYWVQLCGPVSYIIYHSFSY
jgi:hypothetical protein